MPVWSLVGTVVQQLPYSQHIPTIITERLLGFELGQAPVDTTASCPSTPTMVAQDEDTESTSLSPKEKIHSRLLNNRKPELELNFIYSDTCDDFSDALISPISQIKHYSSPPKVNGLASPPKGDHKQAYGFNPVIGSIAEEEEPEDTEEAAVEAREQFSLGLAIASDDSQGRVQQYLEEQNQKFDTLINKNLEVVIEQQDKFDEEFTDNETMIYLMNEFMNLDNQGITKKAKFCGKVLKFTSKKLWDYALPEKKQEVKEEPTVKVEEESFDEIKGTLDNQRKLKLMKSLHKDLLTLDDDELSQLMHELDSNQEIMDILNRINQPQTAGPKNLMIDKIEILMILSIKLFFLSIKFSIPLAYLLYDKFVNNTIFLFNNKNFDKLIDMNIRLMTYLESKLNNNDYLNIFKYGSKPDQEEYAKFYQDFTNDLDSDNNKMLSKMKIWIPLMSKIFNDDKSTKKPDYQRDPKYAKFFSKKPAEKYELGYNKSVDSFKSADYGDEEDTLSLFRVAEQFVDEF